jgi:hypothetical protein
MITIWGVREEIEHRDPEIAVVRLSTLPRTSVPRGSLGTVHPNLGEVSRADREPATLLAYSATDVPYSPVWTSETAGGELARASRSSQFRATVNGKPDPVEMLKSQEPLD